MAFYCRLRGQLAGASEELISLVLLPCCVAVFLELGLMHTVLLNYLKCRPHGQCRRDLTQLTFCLAGADEKENGERWQYCIKYGPLCLCAADPPICSS